MELLNPHNFPVPESLLMLFKISYEHMISYFGLPRYDVELVILNAKQIRCLNRKYRNKDKVTDVLSFPLYPEPYENLLGSICFCFPEIEKNNENLTYEFCFLFIHSFLHLLGFEHGEQMFSLQEYFVNNLFSK